MTTSDPDLFEVRLGVFATQDGLADLVDSALELCGTHSTSAGGTAVAWILYAAAAHELASPGMDGDMTVAELYDELPAQWRVEHPSETPAGRAVHELRIGVLAFNSPQRTMLDQLTAVACADPEHAGPCPIPWSSDIVEPHDDEQRDYLETHYGHLRG